MGQDEVGRRDFLARGALAAGAVAGTVAGLAGCQQTENQPKKPTKPLKVRYGLNLLLYTPTFPPEKVDLIKKVADMGYDGVEIPLIDLTVIDLKAVRKAKEAAGVGLTSCCVMNDGANLCSTDTKERQAGLERLKKMIDLTAEMGGEAAAGPIYAPVRHLTGKARTEDEWKWCLDAVRAAAEHAEKAKVNLAVEPLNRFETYFVNTYADATKLVKEVNHPRLKVLTDTFHGNIEEKDVAASIRACGPYVGHFHASENDRGVPGTGHVPWKECFAALKEIGYDRWVTIESFAQGMVELCAAACIWRPIYESADGLARDGLAFLKKTAAEA